MSIIKSIRERLDHQLERWDARLDALEAQLGETRDETLERVRAGQQRLAAISEQVEERLEDVADLSEEKALDLRTELQALRVQLALGKAETRDAYQAQRRRVSHAVSQVESKLGHFEEHLEDDLADEVESFVRAADRLHVELQAAEVQFALFKAEARDALAQRRKKLEPQLRKLRGELEDVRRQASAEAGQLEKRLAAGVDEFRETMTILFAATDNIGESDLSGQFRVALGQLLAVSLAHDQGGQQRDHEGQCRHQRHRVANGHFHHRRPCR